MPNLVRRRCGYCNGTGEVDVGEFVPDSDECPVCHGTKEVRVPSNYVVCGVCEGSGKKDVGDPFPDIRRCKNCKGTGWGPPPPAYRQQQLGAELENKLLFNLCFVILHFDF